VKSRSIAGEDGKVAVGDMIDEIDATQTFGLQPEVKNDVFNSLTI